MKKISISEALQRALSVENRRILSSWRALIFLERASKTIPADQRRWQTPPRNTAQLQPTITRLVESGEFTKIDELKGLFRTNAPFSRSQAVEEEEILMELHPFASLSHFSALAFHGLTQQLPKEIHATIPSESTRDIYPVGTTPTDWGTMPIVRGRMADFILNRPIRWHRMQPSRIFGTDQYIHHGFPLRVTTPARSLLDGLLNPIDCGGFTNVLEAWAGSRDWLDINDLVTLTERFDIAVLRQRVGFILERLNMTHPRLELWQKSAKKGGSARLNGSAEFVPAVDQRWLLSINASIQAFSYDES